MGKIGSDGNCKKLVRKRSKVKDGRKYTDPTALPTFGKNLCCFQMAYRDIGKLVVHVFKRKSFLIRGRGRI
jgi:hypothetical protein